MWLVRAAEAALVCGVCVSASQNPFSWEAHAGHESATSAPALADGSVYHAPRLVETTQAAEWSRVPSSSICAVSDKTYAASSDENTSQYSPWHVLWFVFTAVICLLLGWSHGVRQTEARFAREQATLDDEQEQRTLALKKASASTAAELSAVRAARVAVADTEPKNESVADAASVSSTDSLFEDTKGSIAESSIPTDVQDDLSSSTGARAPQQHSAQDSAEQVVATAQLSSASDSQTAMATQQQQPQEQQRSENALQAVPQLSSHPQHSSQELAMPSIVSQIIAQSLQHVGLRLEDLGTHDRVHLVSATVQALGVYANHTHQTEDHRLQAQANEQSAARNSIIGQGQANDQASRQAKEQHRQLQDFKNQIADCLMCGLILMVLGILYFGSAFGFWEGQLSQCATLKHSTLASLWRPLKGFDMLLCYGNAFWEFVSSLVILSLTVYCIKRFGLLTDSIAKPMTALLLLLGGVCGWLGHMVIERLGGHAMGWLAAYETWILMQVFAVWCVQPLHTYMQSGWFKLPCYMLFMGVLMPITVAACPFWANWTGFT